MLRPDLPLAMVLALVASVGFAASLPLQEWLIDRSPPETHGQALGLHQNGMMTGQAVFAALAGAIADVLPTHRAVALLAGLSLVTTLLLTRGLRHARPASPLAAVGAPAAPAGR